MKNITISFFKIIFLFTILTFTGGCTATKFLAEDEKYYNGANITFQSSDNITNKRQLSYSLSNELRPTPNLKIFGARPLVWWYFIAGESKNQKGLRHLIKTKIGRPPVLLKDVYPERIKTLLQNKLYNQGYLQANVNYKVDEKPHSGELTYTADIQSRLTINKYEYDDSTHLQPLKNNEVISTNSMLNPGDEFNLEKLEQERNRIEKFMKNQGFYFFNKKYIHFQADTFNTQKEVDLYLQMDQDIPGKALEVYHLDSVKVFLRQGFQNQKEGSGVDPLFIDSLYYYNNYDQRLFKPSVLRRTITLKPGMKYSHSTYNNTLNRLVGLENFKFVNIRFDETTGNRLNANIYLTPVEPKSLRAALKAVSKSNNFIGPALNLTWRNKNFTGASDLLSLTLNGGFETQINTAGTPLNTWEAGITANYSIPRLLTPFPQWENGLPFIPHTQWTFSTRLLNRPNFFKLRAFNMQYSYQWNKTRQKQHELDLMNISFLNFYDRSPDFENSLEGQKLLSESYTEQFIMGSGYSFNYNSLLKEDSEQTVNNFYFNGKIDLSGNLLHLIQNISAPGGDFSSRKIFGQTYAQFSKLSGDFGFFHQIDRNNRLATRLLVGIGLPYGNSSSLPYTKQFAGGGSSSVRAFPARSLGPGSYTPDSLPNNTGNTFFDQTGDIKIETSIEYRFNIIGSFKGALFTDAGNIWLTGKDQDRPGGHFTWQDFTSELALGTGAGLRFDADFFVLRFDLAFPLRKPYLPKGDRWVFKDIAFANPDWRKKNLILNIAIGYPF